MNMRIDVIDPTADGRWEEFVARERRSTIFHTSAWARVIKETYGYLPRYHVAEDETGRIIAAIPFYLIKSRLTGRRLVCLPFSDYCWPLGEDAAIALLVSTVRKEVEGDAASYLEIRGWQNGGSEVPPGLEARHYYNYYLLDLENDIETLSQRLHDSVRRGIHQAKKRGVTVRLTRREEDMEHFYRLHVTTRKKLGILPQPHAFFKSLYHHTISQNLGFTVMAECEGKTVAGVVFLTHKDTIYYKFNASDEDYLPKRPNHLVTWEAVRYACANNYQYLDFGRCAPEEEGLRTFKRRWGAREVDLPYYFYPEVKGFTAVSENCGRYRAMRLFSHTMPEFVFKTAGSLLYKHLG
jgi:CelD/BcsL family acetyltransferase involved in cellulose biosynthesis